MASRTESRTDPRAAGCRYGIPDIALPRIDGGTINPSDLVGHELVVFFCPAEPGAAARITEEYRALAEAFTECGAWIIGVLHDTDEDIRRDRSAIPHPTMARDPGRQGWDAFEALVEPAERAGRDTGATFVFARGGSLERSWPSGCRAAEALAELRRRN